MEQMRNDTQPHSLKGVDTDFFGNDTGFRGFHEGEVWRDDAGVWVVEEVSKTEGRSDDDEDYWRKTWIAQTRPATEAEADSSRDLRRYTFH